MLVRVVHHNLKGFPYIAVCDQEFLWAILSVAPTAGLRYNYVLYRICSYMYIHDAINFIVAANMVAILLCMQLKIHILEQDFHPKMDETYKAVAVNDSSVRDVFFDTFYGGESLSSANILFACPIVVIWVVILIIGIVIFLNIWRRYSNKKHSSLKRPTKVNILSFSIISSVRLIIFLIFDVLAVTYRLPCSDPRVSAVCTFVPMLYNIPLTVLIFDILLLIVAIVFVAISFYLKLKGLRCVKKIQDIHYYCLTFIILCFIISCLMHTPYVTMAYLSDAHYATSVLVYYLTILLFELGLIHHTLKVYFDLRKQNKLKDQFMAVFIVFLIVLLLILLYGLVISLSFYYYYIPINNTITDLPNEGIVVYQTALVLAGAYITYKTVFQKDKKLKEIHAMDNTICETMKANITVLKREIAATNGKIAVLKAKITIMQSKNGNAVEAENSTPQSDAVEAENSTPQSDAVEAENSTPQSENGNAVEAEINQNIETLLKRVLQNKEEMIVWEKQIQLMNIQRSIMHLSDRHSSPSIQTLYDSLKKQERSLLEEEGIKRCKYFCYFEQKKADREQANGENDEPIQRQGDDHGQGNNEQGQINDQRQANGERQGNEINDQGQANGENRRHNIIGIVACLQHCVEGCSLPRRRRPLYQGTNDHDLDGLLNNSDDEEVKQDDSETQLNTEV